VKSTVLRHTLRELVGRGGGDRQYLLRSYSFDTLDRQILLYISYSIRNLRQYLRNLERLTRIESALESRVCLLLVSAQQCMS
jgi:hypothetical protein